jgi:glycerol-3-phosphate cytidylyltransferase
MLHIGHLNLFERLRQLGDRLIVGVSTDAFNRSKGKKTIISFNDRIRLVGALECVDMVIPENDWNQKRDDIRQHDVSIFGMGDDWQGKFDDLKDCCEVVYLSRTHGISTSGLKSTLAKLDAKHVHDLQLALELISAIVQRLE